MNLNMHFQRVPHAIYPIISEHATFKEPIDKYDDFEASIAQQHRQRRLSVA